jgi:hypothetical protein
MSNSNDALYLRLLKMIDIQQYSLDEAYAISLELGKDKEALGLVSNLSERAYEASLPELGGILYSAHKEASKRLLALKDYYKQANPNVKNNKPNSNLLRWNPNDPIWSNREQKQAAIADSKLILDEVTNNIAGEIYNCIYRKIWQQTFANPEVELDLLSDLNMGWDFRRVCISKTEERFKGAKFIKASELVEGEHLYYDLRIEQVEAINPSGDSYTKIIVKNSINTINLPNLDRVAILPNYI